MSAARRPVKKFLFERSFDDPAKLYLPGERRKSEMVAAAAAAAAMGANQQAEAPVTSEVAEEPAAPTVELEFTKAQLEAAKEEGYIQGHTAALEEAATAREHYVADAINVIAQNLDKLEEKQREANAALATEAMRMAFGVIRKVLPEIGHQHALENVEAFIRQVLPIAVGEPRLLVRAHEIIAADLDNRLKEVFRRASFLGGYSVIVDYELQPGDCRLEWEGGGADRNERRIWRDIREAVAGNIGDVDVDALDAAADAMGPSKSSEEVPSVGMTEATTQSAT